MAFNKLNFFEKVLAVQAVYNDAKKQGSTDVWIYENLIEKNFFISKRTFYNYLTIPAMREIKKMQSQTA